MSVDTGLTLPMGKIKRIVKLDPEHVSSTEGANFVLGMATELFVMELTHEASLATKSKKRRKIMYPDFQKAVTSSEKYTFMRDIVPKRVAIGELVQKGLVKLSTKDEEQIKKSIIEGGINNLDDAMGELPDLYDENDSKSDKNESQHQNGSKDDVAME